MHIILIRLAANGVVVEAANNPIGDVIVDKREVWFMPKVRPIYTESSKCPARILYRFKQATRQETVRRTLT